MEKITQREYLPLESDQNITHAFFFPFYLPVLNRKVPLADISGTVLRPS